MSKLLNDYFQRYALASIEFDTVAGVSVGAEAVVDIRAEFSEGYLVQFKLPLAQLPLAQWVSRLGTDNVQWREAAVGEGEFDTAIAAFFGDVAGRFDRVLHEQRVQSIQYLGNRFVLNGKTVFDVVADTDGKLTIAMHRDGETREALLLASSLLDGLYDGSIRLHSEAA